MGRLISSLALLALLGTFGCAGSGGVTYTGQNEAAAEGDWIKDPAARGSTRDESGAREVTRTRSNRVDIPVAEFGAVTGWSDMRGAYVRSGYEAQYIRKAFGAGRYVDYTESGTAVSTYGDAAGAMAVFSRRNATLYGGLVADDRLNHRTGREGLSAYSAEDRPWAEKGSLSADAMVANDRVSVIRGEAYIEGVKSAQGYGAAWGARVAGVHLWKYANRELVSDNMVITYTIVYYNTNDEETGPTVITEPVPFYTRYMQDSATLPREGVTVEFVERPGRDILRWRFPGGIRPGETNRMTYKVTVDLDADYESGPSMPDEDQ